MAGDPGVAAADPGPAGTQAWRRPRPGGTIIDQETQGTLAQHRQFLGINSDCMKQIQRRVGSQEHRQLELMRLVLACMFA